MTKTHDCPSNHKFYASQWWHHVPDHWTVRRIRTVADMRVSNVDKHTKEEELPVRLCNYVDVYKNDRITQQLLFMTATASEDEIERFRLDQNDVIITKDSETWDDIGVPALVTEPAKDLISGYHLAILRPRADTYGPHLFWALQSRPAAYQFHIEAKGVTRYGLSYNGIQSVTIPVPPPDEQKSYRPVPRPRRRADTALHRQQGAAHRPAGGGAAGTGPPGRHPGPGPQRPTQALRGGVAGRCTRALGIKKNQKSRTSNYWTNLLPPRHSEQRRRQTRSKSLEHFWRGDSRRRQCVRSISST